MHLPWHCDCVRCWSMLERKEFSQDNPSCHSVPKANSPQLLSWVMNLLVDKVLDIFPLMIMHVPLLMYNSETFNESFVYEKETGKISIHQSKANAGRISMCLLLSEKLNTDAFESKHASLKWCNNHIQSFSYK